jgi:hypothetical protein
MPHLFKQPVSLFSYTANSQKPYSQNPFSDNHLLSLIIAVFCFQFMQHSTLWCCQLLISLLLLFSVTTMSEPEISLDGLSLSDEGLTLNLNSDPTTIQILEHCLIGRVLTDKQIRFAYFKEHLGNFWKPGKKVSILRLIMVDFCFSSITVWMRLRYLMKDLG